MSRRHQPYDGPDEGVSRIEELEAELASLKQSAARSEQEAWNRGLATGLGHLARHPSGMTAKGVLSDLGITVESLEQGGVEAYDLNAIKESR